MVEFGRRRVPWVEDDPPSATMEGVKNYRESLSGREKTLLIWAAVSAFVALAALAGWAWRLQPMATVWGDVGTWFAGIVTLGGLYYAGRSLRLQTAQRATEDQRHRDEEVERRTAMARSVAVASSWENNWSPPDNWLAEKDRRMRIRCALVNATPYPIDAVVLMIPMIGVGNDPRDVSELVVGTMLPGATIVEYGAWVVGVDIPFSQLVDVVQVRFTDTWGTHWLRGPEVLEQVSDRARTC